MRSTSRAFALVSTLLFTGLAVAPVRAEVGYYPDSKNPSFVLEYPEDWEVAPGEGAGDYVNMSAPTGAALAFRTIPGTEADLKGAIEESISYLQETYKNVKVGDAVDATQNGLKGFYMDGRGNEKADGAPLVFRMAWLALKDGNIAEIWFVAGVDDKEGIAAAGRIINSLRAP